MRLTALFFLLFLAGSAAGAPDVHAQEQEQAPESSSLLSDKNGDGIVDVLAFGDSITFGVGDGEGVSKFAPVVNYSTEEGGYPSRLERLLGVAVVNTGVPGEELVADGVFRVPQTLAANQTDILIVMEGSNDAVKQVTSGAFARALQRVINVARAEGRTVVPMTPPPPTGLHASLAPFTEAYASVVRELARVNNVPFVDVERVWNNVCPELEECPLYNLPEGLHPNELGYDALSQAVAAVLLGIDIFAPEGVANLEAALGLPPGSVIVR